MKIKYQLSDGEVFYCTYTRALDAVAFFNLVREFEFVIRCEVFSSEGQVVAGFDRTENDEVN